MSEAWDYLSPSRLNADCPAALNYRYNMKLQEPPNIYQVLGDVGEAGMEALLRNHTLRLSHQPHVIESECLATLKRRCSETGLDLPTEAEVQRVIEAVLSYDPDPDYSLKTTQEKIHLVHPHLPLPITGYLDFRGEIDGRVVIDDTKVSSAPLSQPKPEWRLQLGVYALAVRSALSLDYLPDTRILYLNRGKKPNCTVMEVRHDAESLSNIFLRSQQLHRYGELNWWPPNRQGKYCNERNCGYWYRCHSDHLVPWSEIL